MEVDKYYLQSHLFLQSIFFKLVPTVIFLFSIYYLFILYLSGENNMFIESL